MVRFSQYLFVQILLLLPQSAFQNKSYQCGIRQTVINELIIQGNEAKQEHWPWHVVVYHLEMHTHKYTCGGTLISEKFILTAKHCVTEANHKKNVKNIYILVGVQKLNVWDGNTIQQHFVQYIHLAPGLPTRRNDIALIELRTEVSFSDYVQPACIDETINLIGKYGTAIGFGLTEIGEVSDVLKQCKMPVVDGNVCVHSDKAFAHLLDETAICVGNATGCKVCNGDSGGGLFFERGGVWYVGGIVSATPSDTTYSSSCSKKGFAAFTKVNEYLKWIKDITELNILPQTALPSECGLHIQNRIARGRNAELFEFPWMALLHTKEHGFSCGGSLIHKRYILTAAHCSKGLTIDFVRLGEYVLDQDIDCHYYDDNICAPPTEDYHIERIIGHPEYSRRSKLNDISLIRIMGEVDFKDNIQPICLPITSALRTQEPLRYIATGWGAVETFGSVSKILQKATIVKRNPMECEQLYSRTRSIFKAEFQICAGGNNNTDTCTGDGGGPLGYSAILSGVRFVQFGITSYGTTCGQNEPNVYTKVGSYMDWIIKNIEA